MKKIMIAACAVAFAAVAQAATFNWGASEKIMAVTASTVKDNGDYAAGTGALRNNGTWSWALQVYAAGTDTLLDSASGTFSTIPVSGKPSLAGVEMSGVGDGVDVDYKIIITGIQNDLRARGKDETAGFDYSAAMVQATLTGSVTTMTLGNTVIGNGKPGTWTVSGITPLEPTPPEPPVVPEPTSGLLALIGAAGLALRRRRA